MIRESKKRVDGFTKFYQRKKQSRRRFDNIENSPKIRNKTKSITRKKSLLYTFIKVLNPHLIHQP